MFVGTEENHEIPGLIASVSDRYSNQAPPEYTVSGVLPLVHPTLF
jgi:hypothetical protein